MKQKEIVPMLNAISVMGNIEIPDLDTALALAELQEKLVSANKKNKDALDKMVNKIVNTYYKVANA